jgi:tetratricopeptide (TPR) repeat protein
MNAPTALEAIEPGPNMLAELQRFFANEIVPALDRGEIKGEEVDLAVANWLQRELPGGSDPGRPVEMEATLAPRALAELSTLQNLTGGARKLVAGAASLNHAIAFIFGDKLFKGYLRELAGEPELRSRLDRLIAAAPALLQQPAQRPAAEEPGPLERPARRARNPASFDADDTLAKLRTLDSKTLRDFLRRAQDQVAAERVRTLFASKAWEELRLFADLYADTTTSHHKAMVLVGRANVYAGEQETAKRVLGVARSLFPDDTEILIYRGAAAARSEDFDAAIADLRAAVALDPASVRIRRELGNALRMASRRAVDTSARRALATEAVALLSEVLDAEYSAVAARTLGRFLYDSGRFEEAVQLADRMLGHAADDVEALLLKSRILVSLNRVGEALELSRRVLELDPASQTAQFMQRAMRFLTDGAVQTLSPTFGDLLVGPEGPTASAALGSEEWTLVAGEGAAVRLRDLPYDWVRLSPADAVPAPFELTAALADAIDPTAGFHSLETPGGAMKLWRREALLGLLESGLVKADLVGLHPFERFYASEPEPTPPGARAIAISRHGSFKFGGGEHFIESMAEHYRSVGYDPVIVGTRPEFRGQTGISNGFPFTFVDDSPATLRQLILSLDVRLVHAISGLGFATAEALSYTNIPLIYGVHFWREALGTDGDENFFDEEGAPLARPEFNYVLARAATVYANSEFTQEVLERAFGVRCPLVFSVPKGNA